MGAKQAKINTRKTTKKKAKTSQPRLKSRVPKLAIAGSVVAIGVGSIIAISSTSPVPIPVVNDNSIVIVVSGEESPLAKDILDKLQVKTAASKDGYSREEFYNGWPSVEGCSLRQRVIRRDFYDTTKLDDDNCTVLSGEFIEPYSGEWQKYSTKEEISNEIQIDHIVALSDAWQKGAQEFDKEVRYQIATDPLNLIAVDSAINRQKSDGDASVWLPPDESFHCAYVAWQISVKYKYQLWVTKAERDTMAGVLEKCPEQRTVRTAE